MTPLSLTVVSDIYACAEGAVFRRHRVACPTLSSYSRTLKRLRFSLGVEAGNDYWREVMWRTFWYRRLASSAPVSPSHPALHGADILSELRSHLENCEETAPQYAPAARQMLAELEVATHEKDNPLLHLIIELLDFADPSDVGILVADSRLLAATQELLERTPVLQGAEAIHVSELRSRGAFERLFFVGAGEWYGRGALSAPRGRSIDVVRYSFVRDDWKPERTFMGARFGNSDSSQPTLPREEDVDEDELDLVEMPITDVEHIVARIGGEAVNASQEVAIAKLVLLEGDAGVFVEADGSSKVFIIDLEAQGEDRVVRLPVTAVDTGMFLLLRTQGGGDYIIPVADRIMGGQASTGRASLNLWKTILRGRVNSYGPGYVAEELMRRAGIGVDANDIRRWMSATTIGTTSPENFRAILRYTGLEARYDQLWDLMHRLQVAHKQAGLQIRQLLLDEVEKADLRILLKMGVMEFELPGENAGSLTAYRVQEVVKEDVLIIPSRLYRPFHRGDASWLE